MPNCDEGTIFLGGEKHNFFLCADRLIDEESSSGAAIGGYSFYELYADTDELTLLDDLSYDYGTGNGSQAPAWYYFYGGNNYDRDYTEGTVISDDEALAIIDGHGEKDYVLTLFSEYAPQENDLSIKKAPGVMGSEEQFQK